MKTKYDALLLCGHGSRHQGACDSFFDLVKTLAPLVAPLDIAGGFLEFARPNIRESIAKLKDKGAKNIRALPLMLTAAGHVKNDIPALLREEGENLGVKITMARDLGLDAKIINAANQKIKESLSASSSDTKPADSMLVVVGRGTSDPDANAQICRLTRFLWEGHGFAWAETTYSGVAYPLIGQSYQRIGGIAESMGIKNVVVYPHFIFDGILIQRIYKACDDLALAHKKLNVIKAPFLGQHPLLVSCLIDRLLDVPQADHMNCSLCKYREFLPAHEHSHNQPQASHHHHHEAGGEHNH